MNHDKLKEEALKIIELGLPESDYIEYKSSEKQADKILKTICAFANNYMNRPHRYLFLGIKEEDSSNSKAIPTRPILGFDKGEIEIVENNIKALTPYINPNPKFDMTSAEIDGRSFVVLGFSDNYGGPFSVNERAEKNKKISLKHGRYIRVESETRLPTFQEEFQLLKKFSNYHFTEAVSDTGTINDLDMSLIKDYLRNTSEKTNTFKASNISICEKLGLLDEADPSKTKLKNFALLMFSDNPEKFIPGAYVSIIRKTDGGESLMEEKIFKGPIYKQEKDVMSFLDAMILSSYTLRPDDKSEHKILWNYPRATLDELITNAIVHKNYENPFPVQIYIYKDRIVISNYNSPLPPVTPKDLNEKTDFPNRQYENKSICSMFKALGLIESYGSGVGKAKEAMKENDSGNIVYEEFKENVQITSVTVPINKEFYNLIKKAGDRYTNSDLEVKKKNLENSNIEDNKRPVIKHKTESDIQSENIESEIDNYTLDRFKEFKKNASEILWGRTEVMEILRCSPATGTKYIKKWLKANLIKPVKGRGKGKFRF